MGEANVRIEELQVREWGDEGLFYENLSDVSKKLVDDIAVAVLGGHGKAMVIGWSHSGKSYLVEQFVSNEDRYIERMPGRDFPIFIKLSRATWSNIENIPGGFDTYINFLESHYQKPKTNFCFVTEIPHVAEMVASNYSQVSVILEVNIATFRALMISDQQGSSKTWSSWSIIDANDVILTRQELVTALYRSLYNEFYQDFGVKLTKKEVTVLVSYFLNKAENLSRERKGGGKEITAPPGFWALSLRRYIGLKVFSKDRFTNKDGTFNSGKIVAEVYRDTIDEFNDVLSNNHPVGTIIIDGRQDQGGFPQEIREMLFSMNSPTDFEEPKDISDFKYKPLSTLKERLSKEVIGQDEAIDKVSEGMMIPAARLNDSTKPLRSFLFLGPTGVGKTKLALTLAEELGESPMNVVRLDMSEYSSEHEVAKLFGSPPGFVGHGEGGVLTNSVKENPYSIVLLDEIEKAHPKVYEQFLQVLDAGRMTSGSGETVDFTNTVIIMTSNLGAKEVSKDSVGFSAMSQEERYSDRQLQASNIINKEVEKNFTPEFINRIDEKVVFTELSKETIEKIILKEFGILSSRMKGRLSLSEVPNDIVLWVLEKAETSKYGAREVQRVISQEVSSPIAKFILEGSDYKSASLKLEKDAITVEGVKNG